MAFDAHKNFAYSRVLLAPTPALSGLSLTIEEGDVGIWPAVSFNATVWPAGVQPLVSNAEIVRVTAIADSVFTIARAQEGSTAQTILGGAREENASEDTVLSLSGPSSAEMDAQSFTAPISGVLRGIWLKVDQSGGPADSFKAELRADNSGSPAAVALASAQVLGSTFSLNPTTSLVYFNLSSAGINVVSGTTYWIVFYRTGAGGGPDSYDIACSSANPYAGGRAKSSTNGGSTWSNVSNFDFVFRADIEAASAYQIAATITAKTLTDVETAVTGDEGNIATLQGQVATLLSNDVTDEANIATLQTQVAALQTQFSPDLALSAMAPDANETIPAGYSAFVASDYEVKAGRVTEIGAGAVLEIG